MLWVEKYRPQKFEDVVGLPQEIPTLIHNLPHLLFVGKPGTGKTTTAKIIIKKLGGDHILLNASDERGINTIREKVKTFCTTKSADNKPKIVFLDEFDYLTPEAQNSLRNMVETYHTNVRFICTANYENKIIPALKSRFVMIRFEQQQKEAITKFLSNIVKEEQLIIKPQTLQVLVEQSKGDIRKCINTLQKLSVNEKEITEEQISLNEELPSKIHQLLQQGNFVAARQTLLNTSVEYDAFLDEYHTFIMDLCINKKQLGKQQTSNIIHHLAEAMVNMNFVLSKEIIVESFLLKTLQELKQQ